MNCLHKNTKAQERTPSLCVFISCWIFHFSLCRPAKVGMGKSIYRAMESCGYMGLTLNLSIAPIIKSVVLCRNLERLNIIGVVFEFCFCDWYLDGVADLWFFKIVNQCFLNYFILNGDSVSGVENVIRFCYVPFKFSAVDFAYFHANGNNFIRLENVLFHHHGVYRKGEYYRYNHRKNGGANYDWFFVFHSLFLTVILVGISGCVSAELKADTREIHKSGSELDFLLGIDFCPRLSVKQTAFRFV